MGHLFDEFSKSLAESVPRRESLRRLGAVFAGAVLGPLVLGTAWAGGTEPSVHGGAAGAIDRNGGKCSACPTGLTNCGGICADLDFDNANCGACGVVCDANYSCQGVCVPIDPYY